MAEASVIYEDAAVVVTRKPPCGCKESERSNPVGDVVEYKGFTIKLIKHADNDYEAEISRKGDREGYMGSFGPTRDLALQRAQNGIDKIRKAIGRGEENPLEDNICKPNVEVTVDPERTEACRVVADSLGPIDTSDKAFNLVKDYLSGKDQEECLVILLDIHYKFRGLAPIAKGQRSKVHVGLSDIMRIVLAAGASRFILIHNHPSGRATASKADKALTKSLAVAVRPFKGDVQFLDHLVIGRSEYYSIREDKLHDV
jgi:hypothetical protein